MVSLGNLDQVQGCVATISINPILSRWLEEGTQKKQQSHQFFLGYQNIFKSQWSQERGSLFFHSPQLRLSEQNGTLESTATPCPTVREV